MFHLRIHSVIVHTWPWLQHCKETLQFPPDDGLSGEGQEQADVSGVTDSARCWALHTCCANPAPAHCWRYPTLWEWVNLRCSVCRFYPFPIEEKKFWPAGALLTSFKGRFQTVEQIAVQFEICLILDQLINSIPVCPTFCISLLFFLNWNTEKGLHSSSTNISVTFKSIWFLEI